jgi:hypothetical protein
MPSNEIQHGAGPSAAAAGVGNEVAVVSEPLLWGSRLVGFCESSTRLEDFVAAVRQRPEKSGVQFTVDALQRWLGHGLVDFMEVFAGKGAFIAAVKNLGMSSAEGIDKLYPSYGRWWDLTRADDRDLLAWIIVQLVPMAVHVGIPCTKLCAMGRNSNDVQNPPADTMALVEFSLEILHHQASIGLLGSRENPVGSSLHKLVNIHGLIVHIMLYRLLGLVPLMASGLCRVVRAKQPNGLTSFTLQPFCKWIENNNNISVIKHVYMVAVELV